MVDPPMKPRTLLVRVDEGEPVMLDEVDGKRVEQGDVWISDEPCLMSIKYDAEGRPASFEKQPDAAHG